MNENITPIKLYFNPRDWYFNQNCPNNRGERSYITDFLGNMTEIYGIGDWDWNSNRTEIYTEFTLQKNTDYIFTFWLNGGENDQGHEICDFQIIFNGINEERHVYRLNRNYINYVKHYKGWYLYEIPFNTYDNDGITQFKFVAFRAHCTIMSAKDKEFYDDLPVDEPIAGLPQRSNLFFAEGYPRNSHWSWKVFGKESSPNNGFGNNMHINMSSNGNHNIAKELFKNIDFYHIGDEIEERIMNEIDIDEIIENISEHIVSKIKSINLTEHNFEKHNK